MDKSTKWKRHEDGQPYSEKAVAALLLRGKSRAEICRALDMPMGTVNYCCTRLYKKAGCKNLVEFIIKHNDMGADTGGKPDQNTNNYKR